MLGQRISTAAVLLVILAAAMYSANAWWLIVLLALGAACAAWEWLRLTLPQPPSAVVSVGVACILFVGMIWMASLWLVPTPVLDHTRIWLVKAVIPITAAIWLVGATTAVVQGRSDAPASNLAWSVFSVPAVLSAWAALTLLFVERGALFLVSLLALVWIADIGAYFAGRAFGKRKLAPKVSPGKTVAGAVAGVLGAVIWIGVSSLWSGSFGHALVERWSLWLALPIAALLGVLSIVGDLFESLLKRRAGRKDSSALLPGHGGVYDRIDAILPVAPVALLLSGVVF